MHNVTNVSQFLSLLFCVYIENTLKLHAEPTTTVPAEKKRFSQSLKWWWWYQIYASMRFHITITIDLKEPQKIIYRNGKQKQRLKFMFYHVITVLSAKSQMIFSLEMLYSIRTILFNNFYSERWLLLLLSISKLIDCSK